jgi:alcohol dehydrogenase class IV
LHLAIDELADQLRHAGCRVSRDVPPRGEPTKTTFERALCAARDASPDCVIGVGGGSVLDVAKLVATLVKSSQRVEECFGIGLLQRREIHLVCMPTTAGTGSEVSPNAILLDEQEQLKKGVISPYLVPDATFIDPKLTVNVPPEITAFTGIDTLTHCIEAYTNKFAHPMVDAFALEGIRLTARFLIRAFKDGADLEAREGMALASYLGGLCLGPVNTAAVHALAYPLGSRFHIAHGLSNAVLLPSVFRFNASANSERHAEVARALGAKNGSSVAEAVEQGVQLLHELQRQCGISANLPQSSITRDEIPAMARSAATVVRLLKNNPREMTIPDIEAIYEECFMMP